MKHLNLHHLHLHVEDLMWTVNLFEMMDQVSQIIEEVDGQWYLDQIMQQIEQHQGMTKYEDHKYVED